MLVKAISISKNSFVVTVVGHINNLSSDTPLIAGIYLTSGDKLALGKHSILILRFEDGSETTINYASIEVLTKNNDEPAIDVIDTESSLSDYTRTVTFSPLNKQHHSYAGIELNQHESLATSGFQSFNTEKAVIVTPELPEYQSTEEIHGLSKDNLDAMLSALEEIQRGGRVVDSQSLVDSYNIILNAADGLRDGDPIASALNYEHIGVTGIDLASEVLLLGDVIDAKRVDDVDTIAKLQLLADAVQAVISASQGVEGTPSKEQLQALGIKGVTDDNLPAIQLAIQNSANDSSGIDSVGKLQTIIFSVSVSDFAVELISKAAEQDNATASSPAVEHYEQAGITGVDSNNIDAINSVLNSDNLNGSALDSREKIQTLVDTYQMIISAADGHADNDETPSQQQYNALGLTEIDNAIKANLLGQVIDRKSPTDVDSFDELQQLVSAVSDLLNAAKGEGTVSVEQLESLGITGIMQDNIDVVNAIIAASNDDGSNISDLGKLQDLLNPVLNTSKDALETLSQLAQDNAISDEHDLLDVYKDAGVIGISEGNIDAINSVLNNPLITGQDTDTTAELQEIVDSYNSILAAADGINDNDEKPTQKDYENLGIDSIDTPKLVEFIGDIIDELPSGSVNTVTELQAISNAAQAVFDAATGHPNVPTKEQLETLGLTGISDEKLADIQQAINESNDDGSGIDSIDELQDLIDDVVDENTALLTISQAAENNNATDSTPTIANYQNAGVNGVNTNNIASINSVLNSPALNGSATNTVAEVQAIVDAYTVILAVADGSDDNDEKPSQLQYSAIGIVGIDNTLKGELLGDIIDVKLKTDIDTFDELQALADIVDSLMSLAKGEGSLTKEQLAAIGIDEVDDENIILINNALATSSDDGSDVASLDDLQTLINNVISATQDALNSLADAAQYDSATSYSPTINVYKNAGISGVSSGNFEAIHSVLNTEFIDGEKADSAAEIQTIVDSYNKVLAAADGINDDDESPIQQDYSNLGITGIDSKTKNQLLGDTIDELSNNDVNTVTKLQSLSDAVQAVMDAATGQQNTPSKSQLESIGLLGITDTILTQIQQTIQSTDNNGQEVDSIDKLQAIIDNIIDENAALQLISDAAQFDNASADTPAINVYQRAGIVGVNTNNLSSINSALNSQKLTGAATNTAVEVQALVDAYQQILDTADNIDNRNSLSLEDYSAIGLAGISDNNRASLFSDILDLKQQEQVDEFLELQSMAEAIDMLFKLIKGEGEVTEHQLTLLGLTGVTDENIALINAAIAASSDDGSDIVSLEDLQALINNTVQMNVQAIDAIVQAAQLDDATAENISVKYTETPASAA